jgi:hypothetical protein
VRPRPQLQAIRLVPSGDRLLVFLVEGPALTTSLNLRLPERIRPQVPILERWIHSQLEEAGGLPWQRLPAELREGGALLHQALDSHERQRSGEVETMVAAGLGGLLARQLPYVRGYLLRDGRLSLSLWADGGILIWEPRTGAGPTYGNRPDPTLEAAILAASPDLRRTLRSTADGMGRISYVHARTDLNGDGRQEVVVYLMGPYVCGTGGCTLQVFRQGARGYRLVTSFPTSRPPIIVSETRHNGWRDLWRLQSGGGAPATYVREAFDGRGYVEKQRIPAAGGAPAGTTVLGGNPSLADGVPLVPRP